LTANYQFYKNNLLILLDEIYHFEVLSAHIALLANFNFLSDSQKKQKKERKKKLSVFPTGIGIATLHLSDFATLRSKYKIL